MDKVDFREKRELLDILLGEAEVLITKKNLEEAGEKIQEAQDLLTSLDAVVSNNIQQRIVTNRSADIARLSEQLNVSYVRQAQLKEPKDSWTFEQAVNYFLKKYPKGFSDQAYIEDERDYKEAANQRFEEKFGLGQADQLLDQDNIDELNKGFRYVFWSSHNADASLNLLSVFEIAALNDALNAKDSARVFFRTLFTTLQHIRPDQISFSNYIQATTNLPEFGSRVATWPVLTLAPFIAQPEKHMFLKPMVTNRTANRLDFELNYRADLNWITYAKLLEMSNKLLHKLKEFGAKDYIDVQSFIWVTGQHPAD